LVTAINCKMQFTSDVDQDKLLGDLVHLILFVGVLNEIYNTIKHL